MPTVKRPITIWFIADDKPGHCSQLIGLERHLKQQADVEVHWFSTNFFASHRLAKHRTQPQIVVGAGHRTHKLVLLFAKCYCAISAVLMKPSLPLFMFDAVICPRHDQVAARPNVLVTDGVINKVVMPKEAPPKLAHTILLGGPSKHYGWNDDGLLNQINRVLSHHSAFSWQVFNSRRTPDTTWSKISEMTCQRQDYRGAPDNGLETILQQSQYVWVTPDSMSMIYEALTAGAQVGLFELPDADKKRSRVRLSIKSLVERGRVVRYSTWNRTHVYAPPGELNEGHKAAEWLLKRCIRCVDDVS